ncbi:MAG TPA: DNA primase [Candidatus Sulfotelmatobacter sp.]|nr:DNA primase [Candidatus Sulfotelmatobacter sp.]
MDAVEEVRSRVIIEDVIGEYVPLKRSGRNWKGLSPFTSEKTPSFIVSPEKQIWKDFSSGKGGSVFDFIMEVEGTDFKGALEILARKTGVDLDQYRSSSGGNSKQKERLYELLDLSAKFYQVQLSKNMDVLNYVSKERRFNKESIVLWRLGYSPNTGDALSSFCKKQGYSESELKNAGLTSQSYRNKTADMFRGRLMIPLQDVQGRVIGFTARTLEADTNQPKYINTPQTILYDKSRHVYGLNNAKTAIRKSNFAVLTEGNLDVIASHQAGVSEAVATAGTAITEHQLKALSRFSGDIRLCFDSDKAGLNATERAIPLAAKAKVSLSIINLSSGKDPDELIRENPKLWQEAITKPQYALDWLIARYTELLDVTSARGKREFSDKMLSVINGLDDPVEKDHYLNVIAKVLNVRVSALSEKFSKGQVEEPKRIKVIKNINEPMDKNQAEYIKTQDKFLALMLKRTTLREFISGSLTKDMLPSENGKKLYEAISKQKDVSVDKLKVKNIEDYVKIEVLLYEELYQGLELDELHDEAARLQADLVHKFVKKQKDKIAVDQKQVSSESDRRLLLEKDKELNLLLTKVKGEI